MAGVRFENITCRYGNHVVLNNFSLEVKESEIMGIVGPSGCGKTTLMRALCGFMKPETGNIYLDDRLVFSASKHVNIAPELRGIGVVFQDYRLIDTMTVYENIAFVLRVIDAPRKQIRKRVPYVMSLVGLQDKADCYPSELSGGEQQRCALARALVNDPALLIADEPTGNVDPELAYELVELLQGINACGTTILMVTHAHEMVRHFGGRIINISEGEVVFDEVIGGAEIEAQ